MLKLNELLREARKRAGKTQGQVAMECGWVDEKEVKDSNPRVANYESGYRTPRIEDIPLLANALKLSPETIFNTVLEDQGRYDLIIKKPDGSVDLFEVKSSTEFIDKFGGLITSLPKIEQYKLAGKIEMIVEEQINNESHD